MKSRKVEKSKSMIPVLRGGQVQPRLEEERGARKSMNLMHADTAQSPGEDPLN